jgi:hypothetical protein
MVTDSGNFLTALIGFFILIAAIVPAVAARRSKKQLVQSKILLQKEIDARQKLQDILF